MKSPVILLQSLWEDFHRLNPGVKGLDRDIITIESRFEHEGYGFLSVALPALGAAFVEGLSTGKFTCPTGFKRVRGGAIPRIFSGMLCEVFDPFSGELKENADIGVIKCLREVLSLFKKTQLTDSDDEFLHQKAVSEFYQCDTIAGSVVIPDRHLHLIGLVSKLILNDLNSESFSDIECKHGPGAVFEGLKGNQKWSSLVNSVKSAEFDLETYGYDTFEYSCSEQSDRSIVSSSLASISFKSRASSCIARLVTVPKSSTSRRTITVEPMLNQFIQQGLNTRLRRSIERCRILSNCLALTDQSENQRLALAGSSTGDWATIDLKSASDLLSVKLVESVFVHHGQFFDHLMDCRSTHITTESKVGTMLRKFAGMGNATTFPVQSICFAVVCIASILDSEGNKPSYWNVRRAARLLRVFGDDIIVSTKYAHQCVNWLETVGLKVNRSKSFLSGNFKESCGVDAYKGYDVTPIYLRYRPDQTSTEPSVIAGLVATSNQAWFRGLYSFSTKLRYEVEERLGKTLPLVGRSSGSLGWHSRIDAANPTRWNRNLHMFETRTYALKALKRSDRLDGYAALLKFFHVPLLGRGVDHLEKTHMRYKNRISPVWVPTYVG